MKQHQIRPSFTFLQELMPIFTNFHSQAYLDLPARSLSKLPPDTR